LYAFCFSWLYQGTDHLYVALGSRLIDHTAWLLLWKAVLSIAVLLLPTVLMGGTLPLLSAWLQKQSNDAGRWAARFYSINSLGAVCGSFLAGFYLIRTLGLVSTLQMTALANILIGFTAIGLGRGILASTARSASGAAADEQTAASTSSPHANPSSPAASEDGRTPIKPYSLSPLVALTGAYPWGWRFWLLAP